MTLTSPASERSLPPLAVLKDMVRLAVPLSLGVLAASGLQFGKTWLVSYHPDTSVLTTLSLLQPYFLMLLAFLETLAITNQVFSARSKNDWPKAGIRRACLMMIGIGSVITAMLVAAALLLKGAIVPEAAGSPLQSAGIFAPDVVDVLPLFILSVIPFFVFEVYNAALRGQGRVKTGVVALFLLMAIDLGTTYVAMFHFDLGFDSILIGNAAGPLIALPIVVAGTYLCSRGSGVTAHRQVAARLFRLTLAVGLPVFLTMIAGFASAAVLFPAMAILRSESAAAFLLIIRLRILFMVPAIAAGSAIAILSNQARGTPEAGAHLMISTPAVIVFYALATLLLVAGAPQLVDLILPGDAVALRLSTVELLLLLAPTFFTTAVATMMQIVLEQMERGVFVLAVTVLVEGATCLTVLAFLRDGSSLSEICLLLVLFSAASLVLYAAQYVLMLRNTQHLREATDAV